MNRPEPFECRDGATGCITCSDEAVPMRVVRPNEERQLAVCEADGRRYLVDTLLLDAVRSGDSLLVHAGIALQRLEVAPE